MSSIPAGSTPVDTNVRPQILLRHEGIPRGAPSRFVDRLPLVPWRTHSLDALKFEARLIRRVSTCAGDSLWMAGSDFGERIALAFEWTRIEADRDVYVADPSTVQCNALLLNESGDTLSAAQHLARFYGLLVGTHWQRLIAESVRMNG